jgi:hypothetical protein
MSEPRRRCCGTCKFFVFGQRSYCGWQWSPGAMKLPTAYRSGGPGHAMWVDDGKRCPTWKAAALANRRTDHG